MRAVLVSAVVLPRVGADIVRARQRALTKRRLRVDCRFVAGVEESQK